MDGYIRARDSRVITYARTPASQWGFASPIFFLFLLYVKCLIYISTYKYWLTNLRDCSGGVIGIESHPHHFVYFLNN